MTPRKFRVRSPHPVDLASGRMCAPGEDVLADPSDPHDAALIDDGVLEEHPAHPRKKKPREEGA